MEFNAGVPVAKISYVTKGLANEMLRKAAKKQRGSMLLYLYGSLLRCVISVSYGGSLLCHARTCN